jgi:hypothetical protein
MDCKYEALFAEKEHGLSACSVDPQCMMGQRRLSQNFRAEEEGQAEQI